MDELVDLRNCFICHEKTENAKIERREYVQYFCQLFNLPESPYEDELLKETSFCSSCIGNIVKIKQLYRKLEKIKEEIINYRNLFENQITGKRSSIALGEETKNNESKLAGSKISPGEVSDTSEKLRTEIINKIQFGVSEDSKKKTADCSDGLRFKLNSENQKTDSVHCGEVQVKIEAENDWSFVDDNDNEYSDNDGSRSDSDYYPQKNNSEHPSIFTRNTRSRTTKQHDPIRKCGTSDYLHSPDKRRKLDIKIENEGSCSESEEEWKPDVLKGNTSSKARLKQGQSTKKKPIKAKVRKKARSTEDEKEKPLKQKSGKKAESSVPWIKCSRENCKVKVRDKNQLNAHIKRHHEGIKKPYVCSEPGCGKAFRIPSSLEEHQAVHSGLKSFVCEFCGKSYFTKQLLSVHRNTIHFQKFPLHCSICEKGIRSQPEMDLHMLKHKDKTPFECHCGKRFSSAFILKSHQLAHNEEFKCLQCNKSFESKSSLKDHNFQHNGLYPYKCTLCDFGTSQKTRFRAHMDAHNGVKVECKVCGKKVSQRCLANHEKTHDSERPKPFVCELCGKAFLDRYKLNSHAIIHTGERPFQCNICGKSANSRGNLTKHMKCHENPGRNERKIQNTPQEGAYPLLLPFC